MPCSTRRFIAPAELIDIHPGAEVWTAGSHIPATGTSRGERNPEGIHATVAKVEAETDRLPGQVGKRRAGPGHLGTRAVSGHRDAACCRKWLDNLAVGVEHIRAQLS